MTKTRTIEWVAGNGSQIKVKMSANPNGSRLQLYIDTMVDGVSLGGMASLEPMDHPVAVAKITNGVKAVGLTQANLDRYNAAKAELEAIITANNAPIDDHERQLDAVSDNTRRIEKVMAYGE